MARLPNRLLLITAALLALGAICTAASPQDGGSSDHNAEMNERGEQVNGIFTDQDKSSLLPVAGWRPV